MFSLLSALSSRTFYLDGGMGTLLQAAGLRAGESPMEWNLSHPEVIRGIHADYYRVGSNLVSANTFGANLLHFDEARLREIVASAVRLVKEAREQVSSEERAQGKEPHPMFVALDMGPTGRLLKPYGDYDFEDAVRCFAATVRLGVEQGVDAIFIETMNDCYETKAALLAAKENSELPVLVSNAYGEDGKLMTGASPAAMVAMLEGMGADAIGVNCSLGPKALMPVVEEYLAHASIPVLFEPNAGMPHVEDGRTLYDVTPQEFGTDVSQMIARGVRVVGGCCGTTPEYIRNLVEKSREIAPVPIVPKNETMVSSYAAAVSFGHDPVLIGERINPTGKKRFKQALVEHDLGYVLNEGIRQQKQGAQVLDVNVGLPEVDEPALLEEVVRELQAILPLPLQIDTSDAIAMERALRRYNGKALVNSVNGKQSVMDQVFPLVKKYGGVVVALTLDESGIPQDAEGRVAIARKIVSEAAKYGIAPKDLLFDPLAMAISSDQHAASVTLEALERIRTELHCHTSLGVSNISFGLPKRDLITSTFFTMALTRGLSAAIMNSHSAEMQKALHAYRALAGLDANCLSYIQYAQSLPETTGTAPAATAQNSTPAPTKEEHSPLFQAVLNGLRDAAGSHAASALAQGSEPMALVQQELIPALDQVGVAFEAKRIFLPQLLMSAEAAQAAFEKVKAFLLEHPGEAAPERCDFILATVHGDIHDIGKNIVRLLLENYGFRVWDLGKDVPPETIVQETIKHHAPLVGLSALMTTTVPAMEETIRQLRASAPWAKVVVGGAVLTQDYADKIGADHYAKDAMETVRYAVQIGG
jgi:5-methyltetrahydrofolate--homocysteine methyltransferase